MSANRDETTTRKPWCTLAWCRSHSRAEFSRQVSPPSAERTETVAGLRKEMMHTMEQHAGIYRSGVGLAEACVKLGELRQRYRRIELHDKTNVYNTDLLQALELGSMLDCAEAVVQSALARKESRGAHQRLDYVERDARGYLKHSLAHWQGGEAPRVDYLDVVITRSQPGVRDYSGAHA